jgi:hypothetical protein
MLDSEKRIDWLTNPDLLSDAIKARRSAATPSLTEGRTYQGQYFAIPAEISEGAASDQILDEKGLRRLGFNVVHDLLSTAVRQICKPLKAVVAPIGGDYARKQACEAFGLVLDGGFEAENFSELATQSVLDAACYPTGGHVLVEVDPLTNDPVDEPLDPGEVFFNYDRTEVVFTRFMTRRKARARFAGKKPELLELIKKLPAAKPKHVVGGDYMSQFTAEDLVAVEYGYALPCGDEPGREVIKLGETVVVDKTHEEMAYLPVASMVWSRGRHGTYDGKPMLRSVAGGQSWLTELIYKLHDSLSGAVPWVMGGDPEWQPTDVPFQRPPADDQGRYPDVKFPPGVSGDVRQAITDLTAMMGRATGVSDQSVEGAPPASLKSGIALANWKSIVNEALSPQHRAWDQLWTQVARIKVSLGAKAWNTPKARAKASNSAILEGIDFAKLKLPEDGYSLSFDVVSALGQHLPMRVELTELALGKGVIDVARYFQQLDIPDWRSIVKRLSGPRDLLELQIATALSKGVVMPPAEFQDPAVVAKEAGDAWCEAMASKPRPKKECLNALRVLARIAKAKTIATTSAPGNSATLANTPAVSSPTTAGAEPLPAAA